jgi:hypothetical protein
MRNVSAVEACERLFKLASGLTQLMGEFKVSAENDSGGVGHVGRSASGPTQAVVRPGRLTSNLLAAQN